MLHVEQTDLRIRCLHTCLQEAMIEPILEEGVDEVMKLSI